MELQKPTKPIWSYFILPVLILVVLFGVHGVGVLFNLHLSRYGLIPRNWDHWYGVFTFFFLHSSWEHLFNNAAALLVLLTLTRYFFPTAFVKITLTSVFVPAFLVFAFAREAVHIGASGAVYSLASFLLVSGVLRANKYTLSMSLLVVFLYGGLWWGMFPVEEHISFEGHTSGAVVGVLTAFLLRNEPLTPLLKENETVKPTGDDIPDIIGDAWKTTQPFDVYYTYVDTNTSHSTDVDAQSDSEGSTIPSSEKREGQNSEGGNLS